MKDSFTGSSHQQLWRKSLLNRDCQPTRSRLITLALLFLAILLTLDNNSPQLPMTCTIWSQEENKKVLEYLTLGLLRSGRSSAEGPCAGSDEVESPATTCLVNCNTVITVQYQTSLSSCHTTVKKRPEESRTRRSVSRSSRRCARIQKWPIFAGAAHPTSVSHDYRIHHTSLHRFLGFPAKDC
ncbi:hypothetical protein AUEXF2481DRAFT_307197 [Aureobasidium subglaciale EXF-2481]|uniref:Uncharacterized protein n=1 Tax=Aureobasidium subglaciale (strain EXF-2481) TaxID=1043005 RepID=A0A074Z4A3_AURSE|nr:uncharacterized protein AUEXF2481DRAFT_307197 [Aureobasidium subglaciale EXF-2481]KEQ93831.1 hypothetical protein AUEXF2481DRAFT_307197 [Aureobasidium subglaciale EXF-2481]